MNDSEANFKQGPAVLEPAARQSPSPVSPAAAFTGTLQPTPVPLTYRIGLAMVAVAMLLLSVIYLGLIALTAYGVYFHLLHDAALVKATGANWFAVGLYVALPVAGVILIFFMVKPYFAGWPDPPPCYSLTPQSDPELFAFINRVCELVRAPLPRRVDVDCQVNASASFRRGLLSLRENDVVLTIGLPLVAGLNLQEFAGVLAHEFGHFAQGAGMRLTYVIRQMNGWFARVVYERDEWDIKLAQAANQIDFRIGVFLQLTRLCVWLSRRVLWVLMHAGHAISCFMLRQMEYDADRYEAKLAGSAAFGRTSARLQELLAGAQWANRKLTESWNERRLPNDLAAFILLSAGDVPSALRQELDEARPKTTRIFDTHPCDADRVRAARALNQSGVFDLAEPATILFSDFAGLSRAATRFHYEHVLQLKVTDQNLVACETLAGESQAQAEIGESLGKYFFGLKLIYRPLLLPGSLPPASPGPALVADLMRSRRAMAQSKAEVERALADYGQAETLYQRGINALLQGSQQATAMAEATQQRLIPVLEPFERHAQTRLTCALQFLVNAAATDKNAVLQSTAAEINRLTAVFARLGSAFVLLQRLHRKFGAFESALEGRNDPALVNAANRRLEELSPELEDIIRQIQASLAGVPYPFNHGRAGLTLDQFARNEVPPAHKLQAIYSNAACHLNRLLPLYEQVLGRLTCLALTAEEQIDSVRARAAAPGAAPAGIAATPDRAQTVLGAPQVAKT